MYFLYSILTAAGMLLLAPYFLVQGLRRGKYLHSLRQRFGFLPQQIAAPAGDTRRAIWIHAVSVGEVLAAIPLAHRLREAFPQHRLLISTTTATGQRVAQERLPAADGVFYFPLDWTHCVERAARTVKPAAVIILETEIWPNFLRVMRRRDVPVIFVNGRVSEKSFARYRGVLQWSGSLEAFLRDVLGSAALFLMQSAEDATRLRAMGAPDDRVEVTGNLKYDLAPPAESSVGAWLAEQIARQERWPIVVAGSVVAGEEEHVLAGFDLVQRKWNRALLVMAPRKPEQFDAAAQIVREDGWNVVRRSSVAVGPSRDIRLHEAADVFLLDSVGELAGMYRLADATFIGGSLVPSGGHNILEPAWFEKPPVFGPSMDNFREMARVFLENMAAVQVWSGVELGHAWVQLIENPQRREQMGHAARALVEQNRGATERSLARISACLETPMNTD